MSLYKRGKTWHTDFTVNGQRYRQSLDTSDWREAQSKEKQLIAQASEGKLIPKTHLFARLGFTEAANRYLEDRLPNLAVRSIETERERIKPLSKYFGQLPLTRISADTVRAYISDWCCAGSSETSKEMALALRRHKTLACASPSWRGPQPRGKTQSANGCSEETRLGECSPSDDLDPEHHHACLRSERAAMEVR